MSTNVLYNLTKNVMLYTAKILESCTVNNDLWNDLFAFARKFTRWDEETPPYL